MTNIELIEDYKKRLEHYKKMINEYKEMIFDNNLKMENDTKYYLESNKRIRKTILEIKEEMKRIKEIIKILKAKK